MILNVAIVAIVLAVVLFLWSPMLKRSVTWRAMTTPIASIIGSGFLVLGPILDSAYGKYAPLVMAALCLGAYAYGAAIRHNITLFNSGAPSQCRLINGLETLSSWTLGFAYIISVAYYLNLFGAFGVSLTPVDDRFHAQVLTSAIFIVILFVGWTRGFKTLEQMEYVSVSGKLAIIAGLLLGLGVYFTAKATDGGLIINAPALVGWPALALGFGLIVTVQGFETSRYLGAEYDSQTRIRSMKWAQWISSAIYMVYILLFAFVFPRGDVALSETAIVHMMAVVTPILPVLLVAAALAAQFSAAVADTSGSGGLIAELSKNTISTRQAYALLVGLGLALTWSANVFEIISYASRAFAVYYGLQAAVAALSSWRARGPLWQILLYALLAVFGAAAALLGQPVES